MGQKKALSKDDSVLEIAPSNGDLSENLLNAYTVTENVRRRNSIGQCCVILHRVNNKE